MFTYESTFSNGETVQQKTKRECGVCLKFTTPKGEVFYTLSKNEKTAIALANESKRIIYVHKNDMSKAAEQARKENAEYAANCKFEIVAAKLITI